MFLHLKSSLKPKAGTPPGLSRPASKNGSDRADRQTQADQFAQPVFLPICGIGRLTESVEYSPKSSIFFQLKITLILLLFNSLRRSPERNLMPSTEPRHRRKPTTLFLNIFLDYDSPERRFFPRTGRGGSEGIEWPKPVDASASAT